MFITLTTWCLSSVCTYFNLFLALNNCFALQTIYRNPTIAIFSTSRGLTRRWNIALCLSCAYHYSSCTLTQRSGSRLSVLPWFKWGGGGSINRQQNLVSFLLIPFLCFLSSSFLVSPYDNHHQVLFQCFTTVLQLVIGHQQRWFHFVNPFVQYGD